MTQLAIETTKYINNFYVEAYFKVSDSEYKHLMAKCRAVPNCKIYEDHLLIRNLSRNKVWKAIGTSVSFQRKDNMIINYYIKESNLPPMNLLS